MAGLINALTSVLPLDQVIVDPLRLLAYGTDASFYRMVPQAVVRVETEQQVQAVMQVARIWNCPVTFRAAGTSLSGQAVTDGILVVIGEGFATCDIAPDAATVRLGPGMIGGQVNARLAPFGRKIGPDPASINACKIGGIAANNASGMCCGTAQNSYRTLAAMRVILADGTVLDTEDAVSVATFRVSHGAMLAHLHMLARQTQSDEVLAARIRHKFKIKNTTGYSLNALVDYHDPLDILTHLMIGSEGTLGFIARITYTTVAEDPHKASALVFFPTIADACRAVTGLRQEAVAAVELLDRAALRSVESQPGLPPIMRELGPDAAALLIEVRAAAQGDLQRRMVRALLVLQDIPVVEPPVFATDAKTCDMYWKVRKGTFPSVGAMRQTGTTVIIEDVAFPLESLAAATLDLQDLLRRHGYAEGIIFGHALEGNLHFVFTQDFSDPAEVARYDRFMRDVCRLVVEKYDGSLKAEHGTGRNMAPFVELEWGRQATQLMRQIKHLFDPDGLLNPGVILNDDPNAHLQHLKPLPAAEDIVDRCIECGFCEPMCPSQGLTLGPRQRITAWREISRLAQAGEAPGRLAQDYVYAGQDTCAGCGLCSTACPVGIDTGSLIRRLRGRQAGMAAQKIGTWTANHFGTVAAVSRLALKAGHGAAALVGDAVVTALSHGAWQPHMPHAAKRSHATGPESGDPVVYFPTCGGRIFGDSDGDQPSQADVVLTLLRRAGYAPRLPARYDQLCCGQMLASKGLADQADHMSRTLLAALKAAADDGQGGFYPVVMDASACSARMQDWAGQGLVIYDLPHFAHDALLPRLRLVKQPGPVALHVNCSLRRTGGEAPLRQVMAACAETVIEPAGVGCCGFGGDRGFAVPELNQYALRYAAEGLPDACVQGYSSNRTCEIGLTAQTGRSYRSIAHLLEECSRNMTETGC